MPGAALRSARMGPAQRRPGGPAYELSHVSDHTEGPTAHTTMEVTSMGWDINTSEVKKLLQDPELRSDIAKAVIEDHDAMGNLAEDIADELEDTLEDDTELKGQIIEAAMASPDFKKKLMKELVDELS